SGDPVHPLAQRRTRGGDSLHSRRRVQASAGRGDARAQAAQGFDERPGGLQDCGPSALRQRPRGLELQSGQRLTGEPRDRPSGQPPDHRIGDAAVGNPDREVLAQHFEVWKYLIGIAADDPGRSESRRPAEARRPDRDDRDRSGGCLGQRLGALVTMSRAAFVFPGQGSQFVGMGKGLSKFAEAKEVFQAADDALGENLSKLCFEGPEEALRQTANTRPAILAVWRAAYAVLARRVPPPAVASGHSLGEYSALPAAGAIAIGEAIRAVRTRGQLMQRAVPEGAGAMAAVLGLAPETVESVCAQVANG